MEPSIYEAAGGAETFHALAHAWHERVMADPVVNHAFSHGFHPRHGERLAAYWIEALGGPMEYSRQYGDESFVLRLHAGNGEHAEMDRRAVDCFEAALGDAQVPDDVRATLLAYFTWATAAKSAYPESPEDVPAGLRVPRWAWDGPVG
ncbi:oxidoreductase [Nocardioides sp.]|uniref:globin domain-containing protein n=1 Tax=Nocardioides sp. TaxID=35761 RepID=UPI003527F51E